MERRKGEGLRFAAHVNVVGDGDDLWPVCVCRECRARSALAVDQDPDCPYGTLAAFMAVEQSEARRDVRLRPAV